MIRIKAAYFRTFLILGSLLSMAIAAGATDFVPGG